jgi:hypothetical protein
VKLPPRAAFSEGVALNDSVLEPSCAVQRCQYGYIGGGYMSYEEEDTSCAVQRCQYGYIATYM